MKKPSRDSAPGFDSEPSPAPDSAPPGAPGAGGDSIPSLSHAEWEVMKPIWDNGPLPARDVFAALPDGHGWAYKTVKTLLSRLVAKGALEYEQVGNTYVYRAVHGRERMTTKEVRGFLDRVLDGSLSPVLAHFIESSDLSDEDITRLRGMLDRKAASRGVRNDGASVGDAGADPSTPGKSRSGKGRNPR